MHICADPIIGYLSLVHTTYFRFTGAWYVGVLVSFPIVSKGIYNARKMIA